MKRLSKKLSKCSISSGDEFSGGASAEAGGTVVPLKLLPLPSIAADMSGNRPAAATRGRILVMDEHPMVEDWVGVLVAADADIVLAGHAACLTQTASLVLQGNPTLVLMETGKDLPRGLAILREVMGQFPDLRILVFSSSDEFSHSVQLLRAGARGFVSKAATGTEFLQAIRQVMADGVYVSKALLNYLAAGVPAAAPLPGAGPGAVLSERELEVYSFIGEGLRPKEIAHRISLSVKTVESYLSRIREKLDLRDARALFQDAVKWSKSRSEQRLR